MTVTQLQILYVIRHAGHVTAGGLAETLCVSPSTATGVVERLVQRGLVARRSRPGDRRIVEIVLTGAGSALLDEVLPWYRAEVGNAVARVPAATLARLARPLEDLAAALEARLSEDGGAEMADPLTAAGPAPRATGR